MAPQPSVEERPPYHLPSCLQRLAWDSQHYGTWGGGGKVSKEWVQPCSRLRREICTWPYLGKSTCFPSRRGVLTPTLISWDPHHSLKGLHHMAGFSFPCKRLSGAGPTGAEGSRKWPRQHSLVSPWAESKVLPHGGRCTLPLPGATEPPLPRLTHTCQAPSGAALCNTRLLVPPSTCLHTLLTTNTGPLWACLPAAQTTKRAPSAGATGT